MWKVCIHPVLLTVRIRNQGHFSIKSKHWAMGLIMSYYDAPREKQTSRRNFKVHFL